MRFVQLALLTTLAAACSSESAFLKDAQSLSSQHGGEVDQLLARNQSLQDRAAKLPADKTGDVNTRLGANQTELQAIKADLSGAPAKIQAADNNGKPEEAKAAFDAQKAAKERTPAAKAELDAIEAALAALESAPAVVMVPTQFTKVLPSGYNVLGNLNGIEAQLLAFIEDANKKVDKNTWFDFDRLLFKTASTQLEMEQSKEQLTNVVEILKAYPKVTLKVGGYTDNVGKPGDNLKLSTGRAKSVAQNLIDLGIDKKRLDPEGYGANHFVCPANDTEECRAKNRRISLRVTAK